MTLHDASISNSLGGVSGRSVDVVDRLDGLDSITLRGIFARGIHGVLESEHHAPPGFFGRPHPMVRFAAGCQLGRRGPHR